MNQLLGELRRAAIYASHVAIRNDRPCFLSIRPEGIELTHVEPLPDGNRTNRRVFTWAELERFVGPHLGAAIIGAIERAKEES